MIEKGFKHKFILSFTGIVLTGLGVMALAFYFIIPDSVTRHYVDAIISFVKADDALSGVVRAALAAEAIVLSGVVVLVAVLTSHKIAGPVYRLRRTLNDLVNTGKAGPIAFRNDDQLQAAAGGFNTMIKGLDERFRAISEAYEEFEGARKEIDDTPESVARLKERVEDLGKAIKRFTV